MKKIIPHLSIKIIIGSVLLFGLNFQNTISIKESFTASAKNGTTISNINPNLTSSTIPDVPNVSQPTTDLPIQNTNLIIKAINPGYTIDGIRDVGEFVELQNNTDASLSLAGYSLRYTNSSGKQTTLVDFSEGSSMVGEFLLLRLARTSNGADAEMVYTTTLAMSNANLELLYNGQVIDRVCWSKEDGCSAVFDSKAPSTLVRDDVSGEFIHWFTSYELHYDPLHPTLQLPLEPDDIDNPELPNTPEETPTAHCHGLEFTEVLSYYSEIQTEQFIELYNVTDQPINLSGCTLSYKKKLYALNGNISPDGYFVIYPHQFTPQFSITKNPNSTNSIELLDIDGSTVDILIYSHGQKKATSYAKFIEADGSESWSLTYAPTPGSINVYQEFRTCPTGKVINPATGNCITVTLTSNNTSTECPAGKYRNPLTGRCKKLESSTTEPKPCAEGYERNPETNRCRKIKAENDGAGYALIPATNSSTSTFAAFGLVILLVMLGVVYIILQFRHEIARTTRKTRQRFYHVRKNLVAWYISFHRHKKP